MHFDRLDDIYAMVESNWHFDKVTQTGLTGYRTGLTGLPRLTSKLGICQFWMSTHS